MLSYVRKFDWILFGSCVILTVFGLAAIYSTSLGGQGSGGEDFGNFWKQTAFVAAGLVMAFAIPAFNYRQLAGLSRFLYGLAIAMLVAVLLFGQTIRGARSWFGFGGFGVQPVELVKIILIVYLAKFFSDYARRAGGLKQIVGSGASLAGVLLLVLLQPDLGSAFLLLAMWGSLLLISGIRRSHLVVIALLCVVTAALSWAFVLKPYQKDRIAVFWDPSRDPSGKGYNVTQSIIAIGSGGFAGKGLGFGSQSQLRFLPERQTDFIFAVIAEELGFLGVLFLAGLFGLFFYRGYRIAAASRDDFTVFLVIGLMVSIAVEVFVNIGGNLRLLPVTGVTLPFVSYGGSSILAKYMMLGILESVAVRR
ncbi:MAG TPA: rod shape-determining protein RodA [Patescibacteria group bacterium]|nr:rod shape-determining protein RodA [Patescibacteria group bacterium]